MLIDKNKYLSLFKNKLIDSANIISEVVSQIEIIALPVLLEANKPLMYEAAKKFLWLDETEAYRELTLDIELMYIERKNEKSENNNPII